MTSPDRDDAMGARPLPPAHYLPQAIVATLLVAVMPVAVVWLLRADGEVRSLWACVLLAVALALGASALGTAYWKRRRPSADMMFGELLLWGWVRRVRIERRLADAGTLLDATVLLEGETRAASVERRAQLLRRLSELLEAQDAYTVGHSRRVARHAGAIARRMSLPEEQVAKIRTAAAVHDVGKLRVPRDILTKPARLTDAEYEVVKHHAAEGGRMVATLGDPELAAIVRHHHERLDGTGYPDGLVADEIPLGARIVAVADTFDAIIATRPYRTAAPHKQAIEVLAQETGTHFDPAVVEAFLKGYSGRRTLALWTVLTVVPQRALAWRRGLGRPSSPSQRAATSTAFAAIAAVALAAPAAQLARHVHPLPAAAKPRAQAASVAAAHPTRRRHPLPVRAPGPSVRTANATCQAYNPQLCTVLGAGGANGTSGAGAAAAGAAGGAGASGSGGAAGGGTLPFTG